MSRLRKDELPPAVQAGDHSRFRPEFLAAIDWGLAPYEDQRPQSVAQWRQALLGVSPVNTEQVATQPKTTTKAASQRFSKEILERAVLLLAEHLGPVARVVVKRTAAKARDERELYLLLGDEIEAPEERKLSSAAEFPSPESRDTVQTFV